MTKAGERVRTGDATFDDYIVIDTWRAAHRWVLNSFQALLRNRTRGTAIVVAQRHKRKRTIFDKLHRLPKMQLGRMDDVAGCRLIFSNCHELYEFRNKFHEAKFKHKLRNHPDKYDYITHPKDDGYRGVHDVYEYESKSIAGQDFKGLFVEVQYRTMFQHAWATANEVVGFITENQPKFGRGDKRYQQVMRLAADIIARVYEGRTGSLPEINNADLVKEFLALDNELGFLRMLRGLSAADSSILDERNVILIIGDDAEKLEILTFQNATSALRELFELERKNPGKDIVLVRGDRPSDIREAFKNYFSDARHFIELIDHGCGALVEDRIVTLRAEDYWYGEPEKPERG